MPLAHNPDQPTPIPSALAHLPTVGGLVVPWITPRTSDGRYLLGSIDHARTARALYARLCGVCGHPLHHRLVLLMRLSDLPLRATAEPALHPHCAAYTSRACPMIAGRLDHYRRTLALLDPTMRHADDCEARAGAPAEPWFAVWLSGYHVVTRHGVLMASYPRRAPLRIRSARPLFPDQP